MIDKYISYLRAKITEVQELLEHADIPEETAQAMREDLSRMLEILAQYAQYE